MATFWLVFNPVIAVILLQTCCLWRFPLSSKIALFISHSIVLVFLFWVNWKTICWQIDIIYQTIYSYFRNLILFIERQNVITILIMKENSSFEDEYTVKYGQISVTLRYLSLYNESIVTGVISHMVKLTQGISSTATVTIDSFSHAYCFHLIK